MSIGRSRRLVGRDRELAALRGWLAQAGDGRGGIYVIAGEPGVGKSRLAGEAIAALPESWFVSRGRATDRGRPAPFRPIAEAMLAASRRRPLPADPDVRAFAAALGRLVPAWGQGDGAGEPVVVVAEAVLRVLRALAAPSPAPPDLAALGVTAREADVLTLVADGLTNKEIGERLFLSPRTVEKHVERLLAKTGASNRSQLVSRAARWGTTLRT